MRLLALDAESFFSQSFSLSRLSTEEYVRSAEFKCHLWGYWAPSEMAAPADCLPDMLLTNEAFRERVRSSAVLAHHAYFDGLILEHHYGLRPAFWLDTLSMARLVLPRLKSHSLAALAEHFGLPPKNVQYTNFKGLRDLPPDVYANLALECQHDVFLTVEIFRRLLPHVPKDELKVIDATIRCFTEPVLRLDRPRMTAFLKAERVRKAKAMLQAGAAIGNAYASPIGTAIQAAPVEHLRAYLDWIETELQSADKFRVALEALGYPCPVKWSEKKECDIPALAKNDDGMKELLEHEDVRVQALAAARLGVKSTIDETRAERLLQASERGALPVYLSYAAAHTLRFGGGDKTNWQNFRRGGEIRKSVVAPDGYKIVVGDASQIEYRLICYVAGQTDKLEALASGRDLYCEFASEFYREQITKDDKPRRGVGKQGILMGGYGAGRQTMIDTAAGGGYGPPVYLSDAEGQRMVDTYRQSHPEVVQFWKWCENTLPILGNGGTSGYSILVPPDGGAEPPILRISDHRIWFPNGTCLNYEGMRWATNVEIFPGQTDDGKGYSWWRPTRKGWVRMWGSKLTADIIQGLARVFICDVMVRLINRGFKPALQVHDELAYVVPDAVAGPVTPKEVTVDKAVPGTLLHLLLSELVTPSAWMLGIPLAAEGLVAENYAK